MGFCENFDGSVKIVIFFNIWWSTKRVYNWIALWIIDKLL